MLRQGVEWFDTEEFPQFNGSNDLYNDQLLANSGSSTQIGVYRSRVGILTQQQMCRLELTYYVTYKGTKGESSIIGP